MRLSKKVLAILLAGTVVLTGCQGRGTAPDQTVAVNGSAGQSASDSEADEKLKVVATIFPQYDFIRAIAGDHVELSMLLPPGSESHSYEPTPQDIIKIQNSDLFVYIGGETDVWIDGILDSLDTSDMRIASLMDMVEVVEEELVEGMEDDHDHEEDHDHENEGHEEHEGQYDEHVWTSPKNAQKIVSQLADMLSELDPANATDYQNNASAYLEQLKALDSQFEQVVAAGNRKTIVFGDRFPFRYFADAYGLDYFAAFPGCSTETEPGAGTIAFLIDKVKEEQIPVVFHIELSNEKIADTICESTGAKKLLLHTSHNLTRKEFDDGVTYLELMQGNVEALKEALN